MKSALLLFFLMTLIFPPTSRAVDEEAARIPCGTKLDVFTTDRSGISGTVISRTADSLFVRTTTDSIVAFDSSQVISLHLSELKSMKGTLKAAGLVAAAGAVCGLAYSAFEGRLTVLEWSGVGAGCGFMSGAMLYTMVDPMPLAFSDIEQCDTRAQTRLGFPGVRIACRF